MALGALYDVTPTVPFSLVVTLPTSLAPFKLQVFLTLDICGSCPCSQAAFPLYTFKSFSAIEAHIRCLSASMIPQWRVSLEDFCHILPPSSRGHWHFLLYTNHCIDAISPAQGETFGSNNPIPFPRKAPWNLLSQRFSLNISA